MNDFQLFVNILFYILYGEFVGMQCLTMYFICIKLYEKAGKMQFFSLHNHSNLSDGRDSVIDIMSHAKSIGLDAIGISDHFYFIQNQNSIIQKQIGVSEDFYSKDTYATYKRIRDYVNSIRRVDESADVKVFVGAEWSVPYNPSKSHFNVMKQIKKDFGFDYIIGSVHAVDDVYVGTNNEITKSYDFHKKYWQTFSLLASDVFDIVGHFDVINISGRNRQREFEPEIDNALNLIKKAGKIVEINTAYCVEESYWFIDKVARLGIPVIISSDAHKKEDICHNFSKEEEKLHNRFDNICLITKVETLNRVFASKRR